MSVPHRSPPVVFLAQPTNRRPFGFEQQTKKQLCNFKAQITKPELLVLRLKPGNLMTFVLMPNQEIRAPRLLVHGVDRTWRHLTSRSFGHRVSDLCLTNRGPLHQVFYSCLDPYHCPSYRTCHLHTRRQANTILHKR
jgi:hypothetical protein